MIKYFFTFLIVSALSLNLHAQTFTGVVNATLAGSGSSTHTIAVSGLPVTSDANYGFYEVSINVAHADASELDIYIISPTGTGVDMINDFTSNIPLGNCVFRFLANQEINQITTGILNGSLMPAQNANNFATLLNGQDPNGTWSLVIDDKSNAANQASLVSWEVTFKSHPYDTMVNSFTSTLPLIKLDVPGGVPGSPKANATMQIIDNNGVNQFNQTGTSYPIGIEKQGFTSSGGDKFNMEIAVRTSSFLVDSTVTILGFNPESDFIFKAAATDNYYIKDAYTFEMSRRGGYYAPYTKFVEIMLNGEYKGLFIMEEKVKRGANRVDVNKTSANTTGGYIYEINPNFSTPGAWYSPFGGYQGPNITNTYEYKMVYPKIAVTTPTQLAYLKGFVDSFEYAMIDTTTFQDPINGWRKWANEKSIIDFIIVSEFSNNYDTYGRSMYFNKQRNDKGNKIRFGPPWDADRGYDGLPNNGWVHINTHGFWVFPFWYVNLRAADSLFNKRLACRYHTLRRNSLSNAAVTTLADSLYNVILSPGSRDAFRWSRYFAPVSDFTNFALARLAWMDANLDSLAFAPNPLTSTTFLQGSTVNIGANPSYTYNFIPGPDTSIYANIPIGNYVAEVSTNYGCATRQAFSVVANNPLNISAIVLQANQVGANTVLSWDINKAVNKSNFIIYATNAKQEFELLNTIAANEALTTYTYATPTTAAITKYKVAYTDAASTQQIKQSNVVIVNAVQLSPTVLFYPNPATSYLQLLPNHFSTYQIINAAQQVMQQGQVVDDIIDVQRLLPGSYVIQFVTENGISIAKQFIKQ
jgi:subtilisin-like proprotein convertase family protein